MRVDLRSPCRMSTCWQADHVSNHHGPPAIQADLSSFSVFTVELRAVQKASFLPSCPFS